MQLHCSSLPNSESVKLIRTSRISQPSWIGYSTTQGPVHQSPSGNPGYPGDTLAPKEGEDHSEFLRLFDLWFLIFCWRLFWKAVCDTRVRREGAHSVVEGCYTHRGADGKVGTEASVTPPVAHTSLPPS